MSLKTWNFLKTMKIVEFFLIIWGELSELEPELDKNGPAPQHWLYVVFQIRIHYMRSGSSLFDKCGSGSKIQAYPKLATGSRFRIRTSDWIRIRNHNPGIRTRCWSELNIFHLILMSIVFVSDFWVIGIWNLLDEIAVREIYFPSFFWKMNTEFLVTTTFELVFSTFFFFFLGADGTDAGNAP
jgi:hypothetical protein